MRKLLMLLVVGAFMVPTIQGPDLAHAQPSPGSGQLIICNKFFQVNQGAVALTKIVSGTSGTSITICGVVANAGAAAGTFSLSYGTGTNCGTGTVVQYPVISLGINGIWIDHNSNANLSVPSVNSSGVPNDLCLVTTGTGPTSFLIYYSQ